MKHSSEYYVAPTTFGRLHKKLWESKSRLESLDMILRVNPTVFEDIEHVAGVDLFVFRDKSHADLKKLRAELSHQLDMDRQAMKAASASFHLYEQALLRERGPGVHQKKQ